MNAADLVAFLVAGFVTGSVAGALGLVVSVLRK